MIRLAREEDASAMLEIYSPHIVSGTCSFETVVPSAEQFGSRIKTGLEKFPWLVSEEKGRVAGYVYAPTHREREAYQWTCECSVYIHEEMKGRGLGKKLYEVLFEILRMQGMINLYAGITLPNAASVRLHEKCGFEAFAHYERIGFKLGRWHDVGWWKRQLNGHSTAPPPPIKFSQLDAAVYQHLLSTD